MWYVGWCVGCGVGVVYGGCEGVFLIIGHTSSHAPDLTRKPAKCILVRNLINTISFYNIYVTSQVKPTVHEYHIYFKNILNPKINMKMFHSNKFYMYKSIHVGAGQSNIHNITRFGDVYWTKPVFMIRDTPSHARVCYIAYAALRNILIYFFVFLGAFG